MYDSRAMAWHFTKVAVFRLLFMAAGLLIAYALINFGYEVCKASCGEVQSEWRPQAPYWSYRVPPEVGQNFVALVPKTGWEWVDRNIACNDNTVCLEVYPISDELWAELEGSALRVGKQATRSLVNESGLPQTHGGDGRIQHALSATAY